MLPKEEVQYFTEHTTRAKLLQLVGPKTKKRLKRYVRANLCKGYSISATEMVTLAREEEIDNDEIPTQDIQSQYDKTVTKNS